MNQFDWRPAVLGGFRAEMPNDITLFAAPDHPGKHETPLWRAQVIRTSRHDDRLTIRRYGRDESAKRYKTAEAAMRAAERIYLDAQT